MEQTPVPPGRYVFGSIRLVTSGSGLLWTAVFLAVFPIHSTTAAETTNVALDQTEVRERFFEAQVRPLLARKCLDCHGENKQESGLRLDSRLAILRGGESGQGAVLPDDPGRSPLLKAVRREGGLQMPPSERDRLTAEEIETLTVWVTSGMAWSRESGSPRELSMDQRLEQSRRSHWSLRPIERPPIPDASRDGHPDIRVANPIDALILQKLLAAELTPSSPADRRVLIRRAAFDVIGLPPAPEEVDDFVEQTAPDAYERLVDRLLASPRYGERWGRHWLDVARYADTRGYAFQKEPNFPYAYTYRDYVVRSFNEDLPYDQFVLQQLAADQLPTDSDNQQLAALGFLTVGRKYLNRNDDFDDQVDVVTRGILGLTVACARCHDHKYDAIPTEDYYSLFGIFANCSQPDELPLLGSPSEASQYAAFQAELDKLRQPVQAFLAQRRQAVVDAAREHVGDYLVRIATDRAESELAQLPWITLKGDTLKPLIVEQWRTFLRDKTDSRHPVFGPWHDLVALSDESFTRLAPDILARWSMAADGLDGGQIHPALKQSLAATPPQSRTDVARLYGALLEGAYNQWKQVGGSEPGERLQQLPPEVAYLARLLVDESSPTRIQGDEPRRFLTRADRNRLAELRKKVEEMEAQSPHAPPRAMVLVDNDRLAPTRVLIRGNQDRPGKEVPRQFVRLVSGETRQPFQAGSGRLELARAIVAPDNPLTARVIANRLWMHHFDAPLVSTPSDFGVRSDPPAQPELLDYLAARLHEDHWSLKDLHRQVLSSATYRQASIHRADAAAADPENRLLWRMNRRRLEFEPLRDGMLVAADRLNTDIGGRAGELTQPTFRRRAIYGKIDRQDLPNLLRVFDFASPDQSSPGRSRTIVPQQALFLLNSPFTIEQAQSLARRTELAGDNDDRQRVARLYAILFGRPPTDEELTIGLRFVAATVHDEGATKLLTPWEQYAHLLLLSNEFSFVD